MIFRPRLAALVLCGEKTVTRRAVSPNPRSPWYQRECALVVGRTYSVQPGRGIPGIGFIRILYVERVALDYLGDLEAQEEGFPGAADFEETWEALHDGYDPEDLVWRVQFEYVGPEYGRALVPVASSLAWELRAAWARGRRVSLSIDGDEVRTEGHVSSVSPTDAYAIVAGLHVPLDRILAIHHPSRLGDSTFHEEGKERWTARVPRALRQIDGQLGLGWET